MALLEAQAESICVERHVYPPTEATGALVAGSSGRVAAVLGESGMLLDSVEGDRVNNITSSDGRTSLDHEELGYTAGSLVRSLVRGGGGGLEGGDPSKERREPNPNLNPNPNPHKVILRREE